MPLILEKKAKCESVLGVREQPAILRKGPSCAVVGNQYYGKAARGNILFLRSAYLGLRSSTHRTVLQVPGLVALGTA
jgi:hypothetical protein